MGQLFGTDGVRGIANREPLTPETAVRIGRGLARLHGSRSGARSRMIIARDPRISGSMLERAVSAGLCAEGVDVLVAGVLPTPGVAFLVRELSANGGVMVSASHNPYSDNGIKIFRPDGRKLTDREQDQLEAWMDAGHPAGEPAEGAAIGQVLRLGDAIDRYAAFCRATFPEEQRLDGLRIVLDCANGADSEVAPRVFGDLGADVRVIHAAPDGININQGCGATDPADLMQEVLQTQAALGLAFDGDGDRLIAVDEKGSPVSGDHLLAIFARWLRSRDRLKNDRVVTTVMSNFGFRLAMKQERIEVVECPVGDRSVADAMAGREAVLGGEPSGHIIFQEFHRTGDGLLAGLQLAAVMADTRQSLSELAAILTCVPQQLINVPVARKPALMETPEIAEAVARAERVLGEDGRILLRYSGTEPVCRVMVEGSDEGLTLRLAGSLADTIRAALG